MRKRRRREIEVFSLSFLDVVSCGFGAIILLLVISQFSEPRVVEQISQDMTAQVQELQEKKKEIRGMSRVINRELVSKREQLSELKEKVARLQAELRKIQGRFRAARTDQEAQEVIAKQLETAREKLTDEMKRLQQMQPVRPKPDAVIGGVPVDSEYIIFVIDTSGSMQRFAWPLVRKKMNEILRIYPHVKGIQVMNDMGDYMFSQYAGRWIPDSPARRRAILSRLVTWAPFSNSSPVEGVERAIRNFYSPDKNISIYILGDDFSKGSIQAVVDTVNQLNRSGRGGRRRVRIHAIGFPVLIKEAPGSANIERFAALMRRLAEDNNGSFVGLSGLR